MPLVRIDEEEKRRIVDVAIAAARVQSGRSKSKVSPELAMHRALGCYTLLRKAADHEIYGALCCIPTRWPNNAEGWPRFIHGRSPRARAAADVALP